MWIDADTTVGTIGYLVEILNTSTGHSHFSIYERPLRTNQSLQPRLHGWCGETDNRSRYARGMVRVTRTTARDRARVVQIRGADLAAALENDGYPGLE